LRSYIQRLSFLSQTGRLICSDLVKIIRGMLESIVLGDSWHTPLGAASSTPTAPSATTTTSTTTSGTTPAYTSADVHQLASSVLLDTGFSIFYGSWRERMSLSSRLLVASSRITTIVDDSKKPAVTSVSASLNRAREIFATRMYSAFGGTDRSLPFARVSFTISLFYLIVPL
jgi:hypothetical protein